MTPSFPHRTHRQDPGGARVTPREALALKFLADCQPMPTHAWRDLVGVSARVATRSTQKMRDLGLVSVHVEALHAENALTLTRAGAAHLARVFGTEAGDYWVPSGIRRVEREHHEMVVDLGVALTVATAKSRTWRLDRLIFERQLRQGIGDTGGRLVPDAAAVLVGPDEERVALLVEADRGTENPSYVLATKMRAFAEAALVGRPMLGATRWVVLCIVDTARRRNRLAEAWHDAELPEGLWFLATREEIGAATVLLPETWWTPRLLPGGRARLVQGNPLQPVPTNPADRRYRRAVENVGSGEDPGRGEPRPLLRSETP